MKEPHTILLREFLVGDEMNVVGYKEAGDELVEFIIRGNKYSWYEAFLRPIGYLYRHYLELELKYWIARLSGTCQTKRKSLFSTLVSLIRRIYSQYPIAQKRDELGKLPKGHNLKKLWNKLKSLVRPLCVSEEEQQFLRDVEDIVLMFHRYDPDGQGFRYSRNTKDEVTLNKLPPKVDVKSIRFSVARVYDFFNGLSGIIEA